MKAIQFLFLIILLLFFASCIEEKEVFTYIKSFFIADDSFNIQGEVFINDNLTEKAVFERFSVKIESVSGWEIECAGMTENKFSVNVSSTVNEISLSENTINLDIEPNIFSNLPSGLPYFPYHVLVFNVDERRARGAIEPEFNMLYYYVYVPEAINASKEIVVEEFGKFGNTIYYYNYDLDFYKPGWYKIYCSRDIPIGNRDVFYSGNNTKVRAPR